MSCRIHMKGYDDIRTLYQIDSLHAWKHNKYFPPVMVEISPTHMCNQKCRYCYAYKAGGAGEKLRDDVLIGSFTQMADAGVKAISVQGTGEPLLHGALPKAVEAGAERGLSIGLTTNGVLLNESLQERMLPHLFFLRLSVLDSNPGRYAYTHGCAEKQWKLLIGNIASAVRLRQKHSLRFLIWASVYLYEDNFRDAYNIVKFYKEMGIDYINLQEATYTEFSPSGKEGYASDRIPKTEIDAMKAEVATLGDDDFRVKVRFPLNDGAHCSGVDSGGWKSDYCQGIKFYAVIASDGEVYPCWRFWGKKEYSYGSLYEKSFEEIWKGEQRGKIDEIVNGRPPSGDECSVCNIPKLNEILYNCRNANSKWKDFLF